MAKVDLQKKQKYLPCNPFAGLKLWYLDADFLREFLVLCPYLPPRASRKISTNTFHLTPVPTDTYFNILNVAATIYLSTMNGRHSMN